MLSHLLCCLLQSVWLPALDGKLQDSSIIVCHVGQVHLSAVVVNKGPNADCWAGGSHRRNVCWTTHAGLQLFKQHT